MCLPDIQARRGHTPFPPKMPFVPGYAIIGIVDAVGKGVSNAAVGDRVAALMAYGGYTEYIFLSQEQLVPVPPNLDPAEAATLMLNYVLAYQTLHLSFMEILPAGAGIVVAECWAANPLLFFLIHGQSTFFVSGRIGLLSTLCAWLYISIIRISSLHSCLTRK